MPEALPLAMGPANTPEPLVTILADKRIRGWPAHDRGAHAGVVPLSDAMTASYTTDVHFAQYITPNGRRLTRDAIDRLDGIAIDTIVFDVDCPQVHGTPEPASEHWRALTCENWHSLVAAHPGAFVHETRGGMRIVYRLVERTIIASHDDATKWSQQYAVCVAYLARRFGIVADPACADWQRLFRVPRATRDGNTPESWPTFGDARNVEALTIDATADDIESACAMSKAFTRVKRVLEFAASAATSDGYGLLYHLLARRGDVQREHGGNAWVIRCPREGEHSAGSAGDGSTLLYRPAIGKELGAIACLHAHCAAMTARDWLALYADHELDAARQAAGITRARRAA